jgi:hypothetical protein
VVSSICALIWAIRAYSQNVIPLKNRQGGGKDLSGTIAQRLNLEHQIHHTVSKLFILAFEPLK